jgi:DNA-binding SARP family transcriptional activator
VRALGPLEVWRDGTLLSGDAWRYAKPRELLLFLLAHPEGRTREQVGLAFWADASAAQVKNNFHVTLHHLRRALGGAEWVVFDDDRYKVDASRGVWFDASTFEREVAAATKELKAARGRKGEGAAAQLADAVRRLRAALALYRGDFLADESAGDWHLEMRDHLQRLHADGLRALGLSMEDAGDHQAAAVVYRRLVLAEELDEDACRRLMLALARSGARTEALRHYDRVAALLRADLDAEPEPETVALHERIRRGELG